MNKRGKIKETLWNSRDGLIPESVLIEDPSINHEHYPYVESGLAGTYHMEDECFIGDDGREYYIPEEYIEFI